MAKPDALTLFALERRLFRLETWGNQMATQVAQIRALLAKYVEIGNGLALGQAEIAKDVADLIAKIKSGAPDLLSADEMAAAEAVQARIQTSADALATLGAQTDASTVTQDPPAGGGGETEL